MSDTALFIPLKAEFYEAFEREDKRTEYRPYGKRWNERTCPPGRRVVLSYGYGKRRRRTGRVVYFYKHKTPAELRGWTACYGDRADAAACICIALDI